MWWWLHSGHFGHIGRTTNKLHFLRLSPLSCIPSLVKVGVLEDNWRFSIRKEQVKLEEQGSASGISINGSCILQNKDQRRKCEIYSYVLLISQQFKRICEYWIKVQTFLYMYKLEVPLSTRQEKGLFTSYTHPSTLRPTPP